MDVERYLQEHGITYERYEHRQVFTVAEAEEHCAHVPGLSNKNIFLRTEKKDAYFLVVLPGSKRLDLKRLANQLEVKKLSLANPDELLHYLGLTPGSVSPFGILNDTEAVVRVIIDREVADAEQVSFHPNINDVSLVLSRAMFSRYLESVPQSIAVLEL